MNEPVPSDAHEQAAPRDEDPTPPSRPVGRYFLVAGNREEGPYTLDELLAKGIGRESLLWQEGLADWVPADQIAEVVAHIPPSIPGSPPPVPASTPAAIGRDTSRVGALPRPRGFVIRHRILMVLWGLSLAIFAIFSIYIDNNLVEYHEGRMVARERLGVALVLGVPSLLLLLGSSSILSLIQVNRMWAAIPEGSARTTPAKAVGLLFVPFFNVYWVFEAVAGLMSDLNAAAASRGIDTRRAPVRLSIAYCSIANLFVIPAIIAPLTYWLELRRLGMGMLVAAQVLFVLRMMLIFDVLGAAKDTASSLAADRLGAPNPTPIREPRGLPTWLLTAICVVSGIYATMTLNELDRAYEPFYYGEKILRETELYSLTIEQGRERQGNYRESLFGWPALLLGFSFGLAGGMARRSILLSVFAASLGSIAGEILGRVTDWYLVPFDLFPDRTTSVWLLVYARAADSLRWSCLGAFAGLIYGLSWGHLRWRALFGGLAAGLVGSIVIGVGVGGKYLLGASPYDSMRAYAILGGLSISVIGLGIGLATRQPRRRRALATEKATIAS